MKPDFNFKYYQELRLIPLIILIYFLSESLVTLGIELLEKNEWKYYRFYPSTALAAGFFSLLDKNLHRLPFLWKFLIKVPLIRGTYRGTIKFNLNDTEMIKACRLVINQTTSKIKVDSYFWNEDESGDVIPNSETQSESLVEDFTQKANDLFELLFYYHQKGNKDSTIPIREGFNKLSYHEQKGRKRFLGTYFAKNSTAAGNGGSMEVSLKSKTLNYI